MTKKELREIAANRLAAISDSARKLLSADAGKAVAELPEFKNAGLIFAYRAMKYECSPDYPVNIARMGGKRTAFPKCYGKELVFYEAADDSFFVKGAYGILEPDPERCRIARDADIVIVPGLGFDLNGARLGRGGGYYDRFLEHSDALKVGICFDCQVFDDVLPEAHDVFMDYVITDRGIIVKNKR